MEAVAADREAILVVNIRNRAGTAGGGKTAAIYVELAVKSVGHVFHGGDFDDAAKFAAIFGGERGGKHAHGIHIVGVELRREGGRAILRQRQAVENILHIVFRAAGVQDTVGFIEPAGLLIDEVGEISSGLGGHFLINGFAADGIDGAGAAGIDQGGRVRHLNLGGDGGNAEGDGHVQRNFRAHFHEIVPRRKSFGADGEAVDTKRAVPAPYSAPSGAI